MAASGGDRENMVNAGEHKSEEKIDAEQLAMASAAAAESAKEQKALAEVTTAIAANPQSEKALMGAHAEAHALARAEADAKFRVGEAARKVGLAISEAAAVAQQQQPGAANPQTTGVPIAYGPEVFRPPGGAGQTFAALPGDPALPATLNGTPMPGGMGAFPLVLVLGALPGAAVAQVQQQNVAGGTGVQHMNGLVCQVEICPNGCAKLFANEYQYWYLASWWSNHCWGCQPSWCRQFW